MQSICRSKDDPQGLKAKCEDLQFSDRHLDKRQLARKLDSRMG
jgi:hypothetical protein